MRDRLLSAILGSAILLVAIGLMRASSDTAAQDSAASTSIKSLSWSPDGQLFAAAGLIEGRLAIRLYDSEGDFVQQRDVSGAVPSLAWSPDSSKLAFLVVGNPDTITVWDINSGEISVTIPQEGGTSTYKIAWSPDGTLLSSVRGALSLWDAAKGRRLVLWPSDNSAAEDVQAFVWYPDGDQIALIGADRILKVCDILANKVVQQVQLTPFIASIAINPDGTRLALGGSDGSVQILDANDIETMITTFQAADETLWHLEWAPQGNQIAAAGSRSDITIWDVNSAEKIATIVKETYGFLEAMAYSANGGRLAYATNPESIAAPPVQQELVGRSSYHESALGGAVQFVVPATAPISAQSEEMPTIIVDIKWHPRGEGLFVIGRGSPEVWGLWLFDTDLQLVRMLPTENVVSADWSPDGTRLSMGRKILDSRTLDVLLMIDATSGIGGWSPDGSQVLAWADDHHLGLYDSRTGELVRTVATGEMIPDAVSWSPSGAYFALVQPTGTTDIISAEDGTNIATVPMEYPLGLRWSYDSRYLVAGFLTEVEAGTPNTLPYAASPTVASVVVWETLTGSVIHKFDGLPSAPMRFRWHPQKAELAGATGEGLIFVWDIESGQQTNLFRTISALTSMDYSPFGGRLAVGSWTADQVVYDSRVFPMARPVGWSQAVITDTVEVIIPDPSLELLDSVQAACVPDSAAETLPTVIDTARDLPAYVDSLRDNTQIPPGCIAELIAVAEALE